MGKEMTKKEHKERHELLHKYLDELVADMIARTKMRPSQMTVFELMNWSFKQTLDPTEEE